MTISSPAFHRNVSPSFQGSIEIHRGKTSNIINFCMFFYYILTYLEVGNIQCTKKTLNIQKGVSWES